MKTSNLFITILFIVSLAALFTTNLILKNEYLKIDVLDPFKNYISVNHKTYSVLDISGSNGYPIQIINKDKNNIKVLRSRLNHFDAELKNDTLFIKFTGSNIPLNQRFDTTTPYGVIIEKDSLCAITSTNTHNRLYNFNKQDLQLTLKGNSFMEVNNCNLNTLKVNLHHNSYLHFESKNTMDAFDLKMTNSSIASLQNIEFKTIRHTLKDSVSIVLSKDAFNSILN